MAAAYDYDLSVNEWEVLRLLWNSLHNQNKMADDDFVRAWGALEKFGHSCLRKMEGVQRTADDNPPQYEVEMWGYFIRDMMGGPFREVMTIKSGYALERAFRKYRAKRLIPSYKEVYDVLSFELNRLVRDGKLCRTGCRAISGDTLFWRTGDDLLHEASFDRCEQCCAKMQDLGMPLCDRDESTLHRRMLTPKQACKIVMGLFDMLGGGYGVRMEVLKKCVFIKTRNLISLHAPAAYTEEVGFTQEETPGMDGGVDEKVWREAKRFSRIPDSDEELYDGGVFDPELECECVAGNEALPDRQMRFLAAAAASRILNGIGKMSKLDREILVGYIFPKMEGKKVSMREFGKSSKIDFRIKNIYRVIRTEMESVLPREIVESYVEDPVAILTIEKLRKSLENGKNVTLNCHGAETEET